MKQLHIKTPLLESTPLSHHLGRPVFLKMEALQPSGSFKNRGIGHLCSVYKKQGAKLFISSSGGNAGLAVAYSGRKLQIPVKVVVPETTSKLMMEKIRSEKAEVIVKGKDWNAADEYARILVDKEKSFYISPYDHPLIWEGHSTIIEELVREGSKPGIIIVAVGGGGLLCGVLEGLHKAGWGDIPVIVVETEGTASFAASIKANKLISLDAITGVATSLGAKMITPVALEWTKKHQIFSQVVTDKTAVEAVYRFADDHRILVEPACGAPLSLIYDQLPLLKDFSSILVIVCGGSGVTRDMLPVWAKKTGAKL